MKIRFRGNLLALYVLLDDEVCLVYSVGTCNLLMGCRLFTKCITYLGAQMHHYI